MSEPVIEPGGQIVEWLYRPADADPKKKLGIAIAAGVAGTLGYALFHDLAIAIVGVCVILFATAEFWLGTRFKLTEKSATSKCGLSVTEVQWSDIKHIAVEGQRITLSTVREKSPLAQFRGVSLRMDEATREAVVAYIKEHCAEHAGTLG